MLCESCILCIVADGIVSLVCFMDLKGMGSYVFGGGQGHSEQ